VLDLVRESSIVPAESAVVRSLVRLSEALLVSMACLAPWAFGSVEAWAECLLAAGIALLAVLRLVIGGITRIDRTRQLLSLPSLALGGLALLAVLQAIPAPGSLVATISPATVRLRGELVPAGPQSLIDASVAPVSPPASTIALDPEAAWREAARLAIVWVLFQCVVGLDGGARLLRRLGMVTAINAALMTLFALIQAFSWDGKIFGIRPSPIPTQWTTGGPFVCHNHYAAYLNLGLGFAIGALLASLQDENETLEARHSHRSRSLGSGSSHRHREGKPRRRLRNRSGQFLWMAYVASVIVIGILTSHSRGGFLAMTAAAGTTLLVLRPKAVRLRAGLLAVLAILPIFLIAMGTDSPFQRLATLRNAGETGLNGRTQIWKAALRSWLEHPLLGTGFGDFEIAIAPDPERDPAVVFYHAENEFLEVLTEGGIVGLGLFALFLGSVVWLGYRSLQDARSSRDRAWVLGSLCAGLALSIQSLGDFPLHVPGIGITAISIAAILSGMGLRSRAIRTAPRGSEADSETGSSQQNRMPLRHRGPAIADLLLCGLAGVLVVFNLDQARAEAYFADTGLPLPGAKQPGTQPGPRTPEELERAADALRQALRYRPDWAEGHFSLGLIEFHRYKLGAKALLVGDESAESNSADQVKDTEETGRSTGKAPNVEPAAEEEEKTFTEQDVELLSEPVWLLGSIHATPPEELERDGGVLEHEPVRDHLLPAARSFLEARRCCPFRAMTHIELGTVDYLLSSDEPTSLHIKRALRVIGADLQALLLAAVTSVQVNEDETAARCWRSVLEVYPHYWPEVAVAASTALPAEQIIDLVLPADGGLEVRVADRIYGDSDEPDDVRERTLFLQAALARAPKAQKLSEAERLWIQGQASARLDDREAAPAFMKAALKLDSEQSDWRREYVDWLMVWGQLKDAHSQARIGIALDPTHKGLRDALAIVVDRMARGESENGEPSASGSETPTRGSAARSLERHRPADPGRSPHASLSPGGRPPFASPTSINP
jgi:hypothetical protein